MKTTHFSTVHLMFTVAFASGFVLACSSADDGSRDLEGNSDASGAASSGSASGTGASSGTGSSAGMGGEGTGGNSGGTGGGDGLPGPFVYSELDEEGRYMIDALFMITQKAYEEITVGKGTDPRTFLDYRLEEMNDALERSLVTTSRVRTLGYHVIGDADFARTGNYPVETLQNLSFWQDWLSDYRATYGADKILLITATSEDPGGAAWGGGDASSYYVDFLPIRHEFGHCMGGSHCNDGSEGALQHGFPFGGYSASGVPNDTTLEGGTAMCGNNSAFYSNPDLVLTQEQIDAYIAAGVMPDQDYSGVMGPEGLVMGDPLYANMAQVWRDAEEDAARRMHTMKYPGYVDTYYEKDDCAGFYGEEGYGAFLYEICSGDERQDLSDGAISSVKLGRHVHASLYSNENFGAGSSCGGLRQRLAFSSPSLAALSEHLGVESIDAGVAAATVYAPLDREAHARLEGEFDYFASDELPFCSSLDGGTLTLMKDAQSFSAAAALRSNEVAVPYSIEFEYSTQHSGDDHGDGLVVFFQKDRAPYENGTEPPRGQLGFIPDGTGIGVALNIYTNTVSIRDGNFDSMKSVSYEPHTLGAWKSVRVEVTASNVAVLIDGMEVLNADTSVGASNSTLGFSAGSGAYTSEFRVRDVVVAAL